MIPCRPVGIREVMSLTPVLGGTYATLARNAQSVATGRGRIVACCYGPRCRRPLHIATPTTVDVPIQATPHERLYEIRLVFGVHQRPSPVQSWVHWTAQTFDMVGAGHSTSSAQQEVTIPSDWVDFDGFNGRSLRPLTPLGLDPSSGMVTQPVWSGWLMHETDPALTADRVLRLTLTWDRDLPPTVLLGLMVIGYDDQEMTGTTPAAGAGIELPAWGTWPGPSPYSLEPGQPVTQEHTRGLVGAGHYLAAYYGRGHVGQVYGLTDALAGLARGANPAAYTSVGYHLIRQRHHATGVRIALHAQSHVGGNVRVTCLDTLANVVIHTGAGAAFAVDVLAIPRDDDVSILQVEAKPDGGGAYHDLLALSIVDRDLTAAELAALA